MMRGAIVAVLAALALPAAAADGPPGTVSTRATARERLANTVADVQLGVETRGRSVAEVRKTLSTVVRPIVALLAAEVGVQRAQTRDLMVTPVMEDDPPRNRPARIVGYAGQLKVSFQADAETLEAVLGDSLSRGANTVDFATLRPREAEVEAARNRLAAEATRVAMERARVVAEAAGSRLGPVQSILVDAATAPPPRPAMLARARGLQEAPPPPPVPVEAGDSEVTATVNVTVSLAP